MSQQSLHYVLKEDKTSLLFALPTDKQKQQGLSKKKFFSHEFSMHLKKIQLVAQQHIISVFSSLYYQSVLLSVWKDKLEV